MTTARARITIPDLMFTLMSLAFLGALWPVFYSVMEQQALDMDPGTLYIYQLLLPGLIIVMFSLVYAKAAGGGA